MTEYCAHDLPGRSAFAAQLRMLNDCSEFGAHVVRTIEGAAHRTRSSEYPGAGYLA